MLQTRSAVDVAAVADPQTGVSMFDAAAGGWLVAGGTSVGAPLIAAAYALSGNPQGPGYSYRARQRVPHDRHAAGYDSSDRPRLAQAASPGSKRRLPGFRYVGASSRPVR